MQGGMCRQLKIKCKNTMHYNGGMCSQNTIFFGSMHFSGGMCSQNCDFWDRWITMEECVAKIVIFWTHA